MGRAAATGGALTWTAQMSAPRQAEKDGLLEPSSCGWDARAAGGPSLALREREYGAAMRNEAGVERANGGVPNVARASLLPLARMTVLMRLTRAG